MAMMDFKKKLNGLLNEDTFSMTPVLELPASGHSSYAKVKTFEGKGIAVSSTSVILRPSSPGDRISDLLSKDLPTLPPLPPPKKTNCYKRARNEGKRDRP